MQNLALSFSLTEPLDFVLNTSCAVGMLLTNRQCWNNNSSLTVSVWELVFVIVLEVSYWTRCLLLVTGTNVVPLVILRCCFGISKCSCNLLLKRLKVKA